MEGHVSPVSTDSSYIKQDIENVRETYMSAIDDFSLEKTDVKVYTSEVRKQMEDRINNLEVENQKLKSKLDKIDKLEEVIENMGTWLGDFEK